MKSLILCVLMLHSLPLYSGEVFRIEIGKDYEKYSNRELKERIWRLERAVSQLQEKVFKLETSGTNNPDSWLCTINSLAGNFTATGGSKVVTKARVAEKCNKKEPGSIFCKDSHIKCEQ